MIIIIIIIIINMLESIYLALTYCMYLWAQSPVERGAPVAQQVKHWPANLAVPGSRPAEGGNLSNRGQRSIPHSLSLSPSHRPDMTEILLKRHEIASYPPIYRQMKLI